MPLMPSLSPRSTECPLLSKRAPSVGLVLRFCRIPPVQPTDEVVASLRLLHPVPPVEDLVSIGSLRRVASQAAPSADTDQVRTAFFFPVHFGGRLLWSAPFSCS